MEYLGINQKIYELENKIEAKISKQFKQIDKTTRNNQFKVLSAFRNNKVSENHFNGSTGYGYSDRGREVLDSVFADIVGADDALVRHNFVSGTHALTVALFGILRPKDCLLSVTGKPYDTLDEVIGIRESDGSLKEFKIEYKQVDFKDNKIDFEGIKNNLKENVKVVFIQRSKGYSNRPSLSVAEIGEIALFVKKIKKDVCIMVDNCYGEFVEEYEPTQVGADLIVGSLIKNVGGGMAQTGGYIAGGKDLVEKCAFRLTSPGIGKEVGATLNQNRDMFKGLFLAPHIVSQALKTAVFASQLFTDLGYKVNPKPNDFRTDIVQAIELGKKEMLLAFCKGIQKGAPVDSFVTPEAWNMPGYDDKVVMAAGTFIQGASIELSADAPLKEPYSVYFQGGLTYESGKAGILFALDELMRNGYCNFKWYMLIYFGGQMYEFI